MAACATSILLSLVEFFQQETELGGFVDGLNQSSANLKQTSLVSLGTGLSDCQEERLCLLCTPLFLFNFFKDGRRRGSRLLHK